MKKWIPVLLLITLITGCSTEKESVNPEPAAVPEKVTMETILPEETIPESEAVLETEIEDSTAVFYAPEEEPEETKKTPETGESESQETDAETVEPDTEEWTNADACDHVYEKTHVTGGDEGECWEYICTNCGDTYYEPYDGPEETESECPHEHVERTILDDGSIDYICPDCGMDGMYFYFDGTDEEYEKQAGAEKESTEIMDDTEVVEK